MIEYLFEYGPWTCNVAQTQYVPNGDGTFHHGWEAQAYIGDFFDDQVFGDSVGEAVEKLANVMQARLAGWAAVPASVCLEAVLNQCTPEKP